MKEQDRTIAVAALRDLARRCADGAYRDALVRAADGFEADAQVASQSPAPLCGVVGYPHAGRRVCQLPKGHGDDYHDNLSGVRWIGNYGPTIAELDATSPAPDYALMAYHIGQAAECQPPDELLRWIESYLRTRLDGAAPAPPRAQIAPTMLTCAANMLRECAVQIEALAVGYGAEQMKSVAKELDAEAARILPGLLAGPARD